MKNLHIENMNSFVVISDIHLRGPKSRLSNLFIEEINKIQDVDAVFLLGDIFDFIAAPVAFFLEYWKDVFDAFKQLKEKGIKVYFIEGNHDFGFEHFQNPRFLECFTECGDFSVTLTHPKYGNILLKHGDDVVCKGRYHPFRHTVKSNWFQKITTSLIPGKWMHAIFSKYATISRSKDQYRTLTMPFMDTKIQKYLAKRHPNCDIFIMGHVHKEIDHVITTSKQVRLLVGSAWFDVPNILFVNESEIKRCLV